MITSLPHHQVSIVTYFAIPPDVRERFPGPEIEKFLSMLRRFVDMPRTDEERLRQWGVEEASTHPAGENVEEVEEEYLTIQVV
jgi:hypothetical protein